MTTPKFISALLAIFLLPSCGKTHRLTDADYAWMPYRGNEILVFTSNTGALDTIFFVKKDTLLAYPEAQSMSGTKYEVVSIACKHTDKTSNGYRYLENSFVELQKSKDGTARLQIALVTKDATFYKLTGSRIDSLESIEPTALRVNDKTYNDVYVIDDEDWLNFKERNDYVSKIYWSKTEGIVRYDKQDGSHWELTNKYGL